MNCTVTLRSRSILVAGLVAGALLVAYVMGASGSGTPRASAADGTAAGVATGLAPVRTVTMAGTGTAHAVPDELSFSVGVSQTRPSLREALAAGNAAMTRVLARLAGFGVETGDVQTTGLDMYPVYDYPASGPPTLRGYRVTQSASVLVRHLARGGGAVNAAVVAGGDAVRVHAIRLVVSDPEAAMERARDAAVAEATAKATQYAGAAGQRLGDVITLREVSRSNPRVPLQYARASAPSDPSAAVPVRAGTDKLAVTIQVVWGLA